MATLTIDLPDDLAEEARDAGLFAPGAIEAMLARMPPPQSR